MVDAGVDVWDGLMTDSDSSSALFSQVTGPDVMDEGDVVAFERTTILTSW